MIKIKLKSSGLGDSQNITPSETSLPPVSVPPDGDSLEEIREVKSPTPSPDFHEHRFFELPLDSATRVKAIAAGLQKRQTTQQLRHILSVNQLEVNKGTEHVHEKSSVEEQELRPAKKLLQQEREDSISPT